MASSKRTASRTVRATGPAVSCSATRGERPLRLKRPRVARMQTRVLNEAGTRTEPPVSSAIATVARFAATAAPEPLLDPPGSNSGLYGFLITPESDETPCQDVAKSDMEVLAIRIPPAALSFV